MSTLTIEIDDAMARDLAEAASASQKPVPEWVKVQLAEAVRRQAIGAAPIVGMPSELFGSPPAPIKSRVLGLHTGEAYWMADDFDAPLEEFKEHI